LDIRRFSRWSFIAGGAASLAACAGAGGTLSPRAGGSFGRSLAKRISPAPSTTALGHAGYQLSSNATSTAFALHSSSGEYAASFAAGPRFIRSTYGDGTQLVLETDMPVTAQWYQLASGIRFRFKKIKKTGSLGLLALDKLGNRVMIHIEKGMLHFSAPKGKGAKTKLPKGHLSRSRAEAFDALHSMMDNKGTWTGDDDFRGASGDYPAGTGWSIVPRKSGARSSGTVRRTELIDYSGGGGSYSGGGSWSGSWSTPSYSSPSASASASTSFSFSYSGTNVAVEEKKNKANTLACMGNSIALVAALLGVGASVVGLFAGCGILGALTLGAGCVAAILGSAAANVALTGAAVLYADACL
jgi:hypothetical protein